MPPVDHDNSAPPTAAASSVALLIIDVQRGLFEQKTPLYNATALLRTLNDLIRRARAAGAPVIFVQHSNKGILKAGTAGWQLHASLAPGPDDMIVQKQHGSAFRDTLLHASLRERGIRTLVAAGLTTHGCVRATCRDAHRLGYGVVLVSDGHSSYHPRAQALIDDWNARLSDEGIALCAAAEVDFAALHVTQ